MTRFLAERILRDLRRPHPFALERVGFLFTREGAGDGGRIVLASTYESVPDENYIGEAGAGAWVDAASIRHARQRILDRQVGCFHVHLHDHDALPVPSAVDTSEMAKVIPSFASLAPTRVHGAIVLSATHGHVRAWDVADRSFALATKVALVGSPLTVWEP